MADLPQSLTCTPDGLVNDYPCAKCLSKTELLAALALVLYAINNAGDTNAGNAATDGKCFCISEHQFLEGIFNSFLEYAIANGSIQDAAAATQSGHCFTCLPPQALRGIILENLCEFLNTNWPVLL